MVEGGADATPGGAAFIEKAREVGPARELPINRLGDPSPPRVARNSGRKTVSVAIPSISSFRPRPQARVETLMKSHLESATFFPCAVESDERPIRQNGRGLWTRGMLAAIEKYKRYL